MGNNLRTSGSYVASLASAVMKGGEALGNVPGLLKIVLEDGSWQRFVTPRGEIVEHDRFVDFATTPPLHGIGADVGLLRRIVADDPVAKDLLDKALQGTSGYRSDLVDNIHEVHIDRPTGTSSDAALRRLRKDAPELHERVLAGDLSPHAAMVEAGFRKKTVSIPIDDAERAARAIKTHASSEFVRELVEWLEGV